MTGEQYTVPYRPVGSMLGAAEVEAVRSVLASGDTLSCGRQRELFEDEFARYVGVPYAVSRRNRTPWPLAGPPTGRRK